MISRMDCAEGWVSLNLTNDSQTLETSIISLGKLKAVFIYFIFVLPEIRIAHLIAVS